MMSQHIMVEQSLHLQGKSELIGAKNAVLVIMASLILTSGKSILTNVPFSDDVLQMINLLTLLGASIVVDSQNNRLEIDTTCLHKYQVTPAIMQKMRASILVMGPLLSRFGRADIALPGGCGLGSRPIDFHLKVFNRMGTTITTKDNFLCAQAKKLKAGKYVLEYPSVGATENIMMAATLAQGTTEIINAALEPEVLDLIVVLKKMGAHITISPPATILIEGVQELYPVNHKIIYDRLEAGSLLLTAAITAGELHLPDAPAYFMDAFLAKLQEMGHSVLYGPENTGIFFKATDRPQAISIKTMPYPGFPTDLQAPMMAALTLANGISTVTETVFENRLTHVPELKKMGAHIEVQGQTAIIKGVDCLQGTIVAAPDIRASWALVIAGLAAKGHTQISGVHHLKRGYYNIIPKLNALGAKISIL